MGYHSVFESLNDKNFDFENFPNFDVFEIPDSEPFAYKQINSLFQKKVICLLYIALPGLRDFADIFIFVYDVDYLNVDFRNKQIIIFYQYSVFDLAPIFYPFRIENISPRLPKNRGLKINYEVRGIIRRHRTAQRLRYEPVDCLRRYYIPKKGFSDCSASKYNS